MPIRQHDIDNFFSRSSSAAATPSKPGRSSARQSEVITIDDSDEDVAPSVRPTVQTANITPSTWSQRRAPLASSSRTQRPRELSITSGEEGAPNEEEYSSGEDIRDVKLSPTQTHRWSITQRRVIDPDDDHSESAHQSSRKPTRGHTSDSESGKPLRTTRNRSSTTRVTRSSGKRKARASSSDESERTPPPETKRKGTVGSRARVKNVSRRSDSSQEDITARHTTRRREAPSSSRNGKVTRARATRPDESASEGSDSVSQAPSQPKETPAKRRLRRMRMKRLGRDISSSEDRVISSDGLEVSDSRTPIRRARRPKPKGSSKRRRATDPDEDTGGGADTEEEAPDELQLDEPERFKTTTRLRKRKETAHQRLLRKLKNKRLNLPSSESESEDSEEEEEEDHQSLPDSLDDSSSGFITEDGEEVNESLMPAEFSLGYAQSKEYKFKVMFQYLLLVVMHGPGVLPLKGKQKEYMQPVAELREYIKGIRNLRVRSQIWRAEFVRAMEMYPEFQVTDLIDIERYCDVCNRRNQHCWQHGYLTGKPYDPKSHETLGPAKKPSTSDDSSGSDEEDSDKEPLPRSFNMGPHCCDSAKLYHALSHWEHELFLTIKGVYRQLRRASDAEISSDESEGEATGEIFRPPRRHLQQTGLPNVRDINAVLEWMESKDYQNNAFDEFARLEDKARKLGGDDAKMSERDHA